jgi:hypothetical protein
MPTSQRHAHGKAGGAQFALIARDACGLGNLRCAGVGHVCSNACMVTRLERAAWDANHIYASLGYRRSPRGIRKLIFRVFFRSDQQEWNQTLLLAVQHQLTLRDAAYLEPATEPTIGHAGRGIAADGENRKGSVARVRRAAKIKTPLLAKIGQKWGTLAKFLYCVSRVRS